MRMRKKKNLDVRFAACADVMAFEPKEKRGKWRALFGNDNPIHLEIGCGKGRFTADTAELLPDTLYIAMEKVPDAMVVAMERAASAGLRNVFFIDIDANQLPEIFDQGEVDRIYVNFCDPWPPKRQAKRRLTHGNFLKL